jgi:hypothetical protein
MGSIFPVVRASYPGQEARANDLMTFPTLFMGLGNFISMPLALSIGRRPVFLASVLLLAISGMWCALSTSLGSHIAGRNILAMAAGQSEALVPMMVQEIFFLHERGTMISWFISLQNVISCGFAMATTYMVADWGWRWWYGFFSVVNGVLFVVSWIWVSETGFERSSTDFVGQNSPEVTKLGTDSKHIETVGKVPVAAVSVSERPRATAWSVRDLRPITKPNRDWSQMITFYKHFAQSFALPAMVWILLVNGAYLGLYVFQASTFAQVLLAPPYSFAYTSLGYVQAAQVVVTVVFLPLLGYGGDWVITFLSKRNNGVFEPEFRLIPLAAPSIVAVICAVMYGQAASNPTAYSWATVAVTYNATFFGFLGANIVGITYAIDSFPMRAGPLLVVICAGRGLISFGLAYATLPAITAIGYDGVMIAEAAIAGGLTLLVVPVYIWGAKLRLLANRWFRFGDSATKPSEAA